MCISFCDTKPRHCRPFLSVSSRVFVSLEFSSWILLGVPGDSSRILAEFTHPGLVHASNPSCCFAVIHFLGVAPSCCGGRVALLLAKELVISFGLNHRSLVERSLLLRDCLATGSTDRGADV
jgi:hypothetical protein